MGTATVTVTAKDGTHRMFTVPIHSSAPTARFAGDPGPGRRYDGCSIQGGDMSNVEAAAGATVGVSRQYFVDTTTVATIKATLQRDVGLKRYPVYSTKVPNADWSAIAAGTHDADWLIPRLDAIASVGKPMTLVLHHEPENDVGDSAGQTVKSFHDMYTHAFSIINARYPMIALAPVYMGGKYNPNILGGAELVFTDWALKRGTQCHYMLFDEYNQSSGPQTTEKNWLMPAQLHGNMVALIKAWDPQMAWGVAEFGCRISVGNPGKAAAWWTAFYLLMDQLGAVLTSAFDSAQNSPNGPWVVNLPPTVDERWPIFKARIVTSAHPA